MCFGDVFAEFACGVYFGAEHVGVADSEDFAKAKADAEEDFFLVFLVGVVFFEGALHRDGAVHALGHVAENDEKAVAFDFQKDAVVILDDRDQEALGLVDRLQEMDDAEFRDVAGEAGKVGEHDAPVFAEKVPDALVYFFFIGAGLKSFFNQFFQAVFRRAYVYRTFVCHGNSIPRARQAVKFTV